MLYEKVKLTSIEHEQGNSVLPKFCHAALRVYDVVAVNAIYMIKLFRIYWYAAVNLLWSLDTIWRHRSRSTWAQVMACCLTALSHCLYQCSHIINSIMLCGIRLTTILQELLRYHCIKLDWILCVLMKLSPENDLIQILHKHCYIMIKQVWGNQCYPVMHVSFSISLVLKLWSAALISIIQFNVWVCFLSLAQSKLRLWLAEHSLSLLQARARKQALMNSCNSFILICNTKPWKSRNFMTDVITTSHILNYGFYASE